MILRYVNSGGRWFGEKPYLPFARLSWEFYFVVEGLCGMILEGGERMPLKRSHLWLLPPNFIHGWYGESGKECSILVFHYASIPQQLERIVPRDSFYEQELTRKECQYLRKLEAPLEKDFHTPNPLNDIHHHKVLMELALFILEGKGRERSDPVRHQVSSSVEAALTWFGQNIRDCPSIEDVARAVHVSTSHLRRLFREVRNQSPSEAMNEVKLQCAMRALTDSDAKVETIASECGFSSASVFCRSFKVRNRCTPAEWRRRMPV